jgi:hypothetical protein
LNKFSKITNKLNNIEEIEKRVKDLEKRVIVLEKQEKTKILKRKGSDFFESQIKEKVSEIGIMHLVILALKIKSKQSKEQIKNKLEEWEKSIGSWFRGGNFNSRLLKKGFVMKDGKNKGTDDDVFSLTMRGNRLAEKLIEKYKLN